MSRSYVRVLLLPWNFPHIFFVCRLRKPIGSQWFKKVLLEFLVFNGIYSFFIKWWNSTKPFFFSWISSTSVKPFFSQKYSRNIYDLLNFTSMDFFWLFGFWQESHWFYTSFLRKAYNLSIFLTTSHAVFGRLLPSAIISHHFMIQSLGFEKGLTN